MHFGHVSIIWLNLSHRGFNYSNLPPHTPGWMWWTRSAEHDATLPVFNQCATSQKDKRECFSDKSPTFQKRLGLTKHEYNRILRGKERIRQKSDRSDLLFHPVRHLPAGSILPLLWEMCFSGRPFVQGIQIFLSGFCLSSRGEISIGSSLSGIQAVAPCLSPSRLRRGALSRYASAGYRGAEKHRLLVTVTAGNNAQRWKFEENNQPNANHQECYITCLIIKLALFHPIVLLSILRAQTFSQRRIWECQRMQHGTHYGM